MKPNQQQAFSDFNEIKSIIEQDLGDYSVLELAGRGTFSSVFKIENREKRTIYALKVIEFSHQIGDREIEMEEKCVAIFEIRDANSITV
jgi:serine/threonine protein kinase